MTIDNMTIDKMTEDWLSIVKSTLEKITFDIMTCCQIYSACLEILPILKNMEPVL